MLRSTRHSRRVPVAARDMRRERRDLEVVLDVDRQRVDDRARRCASSSTSTRAGAQRRRVERTRGASHACRSAAMRSAAWPSHSSGMRPRLPPVCEDLVDARAITRARSRPTSVLVPCSTVIGRSVFVAHRQAGHGERRRLLLDAAGVGQHQRARPPAGRASRDSPAAAAARSRAVGASAASPKRSMLAARARMHAATPAAAARDDLAQHAERLARAHRDCRRSMADAASRRRSRPRRSTRCGIDAGARKRRRPAAPRARRCAQQRIDHHVADESHARGASMPSRARLSRASRSVV